MSNLNQAQNGITVGYLNVYHLINKFHEVNILMNNHSDKVHLFGISESWLDDNTDNSSIHINNYSIIRKDKDKSKHGHHGIAIYIHDSIQNFVKRRSDLESDKIETIWLEFRINKSPPAFICFL